MHAKVEAALYLPLRRILFRIVYSYLAESSKNMQRAMMLLQQATPSFFQIGGSQSDIMT